MLKEIIERIRAMQTKATPYKTLIDTRKLSTAKKQKIRKETTEPQVKNKKAPKSMKSMGKGMKKGY